MKLVYKHLFLVSYCSILILVSQSQYTGRFDNYLNHSCIRDCTLNTESKICEYEWTLELYSTLGRACYNCPTNLTDCYRENCIAADGVLKTVEVINKMFPGPPIHVCKGDTIIVKVNNNLRSERVTSIHWHGVQLKNNPWMDGVGMITQYPIIPHTSFQYKFVTNNPGTHYWHSHSGYVDLIADCLVDKRVLYIGKIDKLLNDGVFGALIVRESKKDDVLSSLYDFDLKEHNMILIEWSKNPFQIDYGPYMHAAAYLNEHTILVNGKGQWTNQPNLLVPLETFYVKKGFRYRFRVINNGIQNCMLQLSVDDHNLTMISTDGQPIEPIEVESFCSGTGQRYDFVLNANKNEKDYWIKIRGEGDCNYLNMSQRAILRYERKDLSNGYDSTLPYTFQDSYRGGLQLRDIPPVEDNQTYIQIDKLKYPKNLNENYFKRISEKPDKKVYLNLDVVSVDDSEMHQVDLYPFIKSVNTWKTSAIDNIKFQMPPLPPLLDWDNIPKNIFCNKTYQDHVCPNNKQTKICSCVHLLEVKLNDLVEFILIDGGGLPEPHSSHLHGHNFAVLGIEQVSVVANSTKIKHVTSELVEDLDNKNLLKRNFDRPPLRDTITMPTAGYAIIRFVADNPGFWLFHCHLDSHADSGMILVIKVGDRKDLPLSNEAQAYERCKFQQDLYIKSSNENIKIEKLYFYSLLFISLYNLLF